MPLNEKDVWDNIKSGKVINMFQFDGDVGVAALKKVQPQTIIELTDANSEMRLMASEKGAETPLDKYARFKNNISLWYDEMKQYNLTDKEVKVIEPYFLKSYGVPPSQEQLMQMLMDPEICNFSLADANKARKIVGKKQMDKIPDLREKVLKSAKSSALGHYIWKFGIGPQMGYAFSVIHALAYSIIGYQTAYIATKWNPIYWNCACLIVNSASIEDEPIEDADLADDNVEEDDEEEKKSSNTNYEKIAKAIGIIQQQGVKVSLLDINKSGYTFEPDIENGTIMYGFKPLTNINDEVIEQIYRNRPYVSIKDFMNKITLKKPAMVALIKGGAFDNVDKEWAADVGMDVRKASMAYYISKICEPKTRLNLQNFNALIEKNLLPDDMDIYKALYKFNKARCNREEIVLNETIVSELNEYLDFEDLIDELKILDFNYNANIKLYTISKKSWKKIYDKLMDVPREYLKTHQKEMLQKYNRVLFQECWDKYALGNLSKWEMDSLCFYYNEHELAHVDKAMFGIKEFKELPEDPVPARYFRRNGRDIPLWQLSVIIGTVIGKNDSKSTISLLTTEGVISVKFTKDFYAMFKRQISQLQEDGKKKVVEAGWFKRGTKLMITGFRRGDMFVGKTYADTPTHQLYKINDVTENGELVLQSERAKTE
jgi:DNA polymerase-3 subunit alpha